MRYGLEIYSEAGDLAFKLDQTAMSVVEVVEFPAGMPLTKRDVFENPWTVGFWHWSYEYPTTVDYNDGNHAALWFGSKDLVPALFAGLAFVGEFVQEHCVVLTNEIRVSVSEGAGIATVQNGEAYKTRPSRLVIARFS